MFLLSRIVDDEERSFAISLTSFAINLLGEHFIPLSYIHAQGLVVLRHAVLVIVDELMMIMVVVVMVVCRLVLVVLMMMVVQFMKMKIMTTTIITRMIIVIVATHNVTIISQRLRHHLHIHELDDGDLDGDRKGRKELTLLRIYKININLNARLITTLGETTHPNLPRTFQLSCQLRCSTVL